MVNPVPERPALPQTVPQTTAGLLSWSSDLLKALISVLQGLGYRLNSVLPKDGTEAMTQPLPLWKALQADVPAAADWEGGVLYVDDLDEFWVSDGAVWHRFAREVASQAEAEAGLDNSKIMTALRVQQHFDANHIAPAEFSHVGARVTHSVAQSLPNNVFTTLAFDTEDWDTDTIHDTATNNTRLTAKTAGKYIVTGYIGFNNGTGQRVFRIVKNGATVQAEHRIEDVAAITAVMSIASIVNLAVNDYVELSVFQNDGAAVNTLITNGSPAFAMHRIAD